jgi:hypothetical protein
MITRIVDQNEGSRPSNGLTRAADTPAISPDYMPSRRSDLNFRIIEGEMVVLDRKRGLVHQLNPTASLIWNRCDGQSTIRTIAGHLVRTYDVDLATALGDISKVVGDFRGHGLLAERRRKKKQTS